MAFRGSGAVTIDNPAFDDHASPCFQCSYCGIPKHRSGFSSHNLQSALGDCHERRQTPATAEGPWRGALVRCHLDGRGQLVSRQFNDWFISQGAPQAAPQDAQQGAEVVILVPPEKWLQHFGDKPPVFQAPVADGVADLSQQRIRLEAKVCMQDGVPIAEQTELLTLCCYECANRKQEQRDQGKPEMKPVDDLHKGTVHGHLSGPRNS
eukprot:TRINITY_DN2674_c0_g1_i1.p1 TRINITY_DN2674_c0_g1~~TRINITY_DN2674_c0_g1_i1.p1  ORF type:complete len:208 (+),score=64.07 TRINITY_DN2674_c0_g1_i1:96-719(+)